jgi:NDP-sugar pyrophosphorylase family protein
VRFVEAATRRPLDATVLAVTPLIADEKPLRVAVGAGGRVTDIGGEAGDLVTAGIYLVPKRVRELSPPPGLEQSMGSPRPAGPRPRDGLPREHPRLRDFLRWLVRSGEPVYGEIIEQVIDVDRAEDVALAETLALAGRVS